MERLLGTALACLVISLLVLGCGGGSASESSSSSTANNSGSLAEFNNENSAVTFGKEASQAELEEASRLVARTLQTRSDHDWAGQCATLSKAAIKQFKSEGPASVKNSPCGVALGAQGKLAPQSILRDNLRGSVVALRVQGKTGFAFYHGNDSKDWAMPMEKEAGQWRVNSLLAEELIG